MQTGTTGASIPVLSSLLFKVSSSAAEQHADVTNDLAAAALSLSGESLPLALAAVAQQYCRICGAGYEETRSCNGETRTVKWLGCQVSFH
jgi:hypothetical protein